jgi:iron(III) transport system substrate-binding protein
MGITRRAFTAGAGTLLAGGARAQDAKAWEPVIEAARKEGGVTLSTGLESPVVRTVLANFEKKYGVPVNSLVGRPSEVRERIRVAAIAGRQQVDVVFGSEALTNIRYREDKTVADVAPLLQGDLARTSLKTSVQFLPQITITYGLMVNTAMVKPEDEPKGFFDLLDPKWKNRILIDDPRTNGPGHIYFIGTELWGKEKHLDFHKRMAAQNPVFVIGTQEAARKVVRGEYPVLVAFTLPDITPLAGLPVKAVPPVEGCPYVLYGCSMVAGAPHPNAAMLFSHYNSSDEALTEYAKAGFGCGVRDVIEKAPASVRPMIDVKLLGTTDPAGQEEALKAAKAIYG